MAEFPKGEEVLSLMKQGWTLSHPSHPLNDYPPISREGEDGGMETRDVHWNTVYALERRGLIAPRARYEWQLALPKEEVLEKLKEHAFLEWVCGCTTDHEMVLITQVGSSDVQVVSVRTFLALEKEKKIKNIKTEWLGDHEHSELFALA